MANLSCIINSMAADDLAMTRARTSAIKPSSPEIFQSQHQKGLSTHPQKALRALSYHGGSLKGNKKQKWKSISIAPLMLYVRFIDVEIGCGISMDRITQVIRVKWSSHVQGLSWVWAQPMRYSVTNKRRPSLAVHMPRMIPVRVNWGNPIHRYSKCKDISRILVSHFEKRRLVNENAIKISHS